MKVNIKSVLKTSAHDFQCFDDDQIIFPSGNLLCIKEINKNQTQFICLNKHIQHLYSFKPSANRKGVYTAQKLSNSIEIAYYNLKGDRRSINFTQQNPSFCEIIKIQLLVDDYDNHLVYGAAQNKQGSCIFLCDMNKLRILAQGFLPHFSDIKIDMRQNMALSICGHNGNYNYRKSLKYELGQWQMQEHLYKKINHSHGPIIAHQLLNGHRVLLATKKVIYIFQDTHVLQQIQLPQSQSIEQIIKFRRAFLVVMQGRRIKAYIQDHDEVTYIQKSFLPIDLDEDDTIYKIQASHNNDYIVVKTIKNNLYIWKTQYIDLQPTHPEMKFTKIETSCSGEKDGTISISSDKHYCALSGRKVVTLWSLQNNEIVLSSEFGINQKNKHIITCAINPDGNSFIVSFEDRIRIYKILLNKFKFHAEMYVKHCDNIVYSHGGQFVACKYGTSIQIFNLVQMASINIIKAYTEPLQIIWSELDDQIIVSGQNQTIQIFKAYENVRLYNVKIDSAISFVRFDFVSKKLLVSTENKIVVVHNEKIVDQIVPKVQQFHYVYPLYGMYFIVSKNGVLYWSSSITFQRYHQYSLFTNSPFQLICRTNLLIAYSSFQDVVILECVGQDDKPDQNEGEIVMVEKQQIQSLFSKVKHLETNFDMLINSTNVRLQEERNNYQASIMKFRSQLGKQINFVQTKFTDISHSKIKQEKQSQKIFQTIEINQVKGLNSLEDMFNRKLSLQKQKNMNLSQSFEQQKVRYEQIIFDLQSKYHREIKQVRSQYSSKIKDQSSKTEILKLNSLNDKQRVQIKLLDMQQQNQQVMNHIQQDSNLIVAELQSKIKALEEQYNNLLLKYRNQEEASNQIEQEQYKKNYDYRKLQAILEQTNNRVKLLEKDLSHKLTIITEKQERIHMQQHQLEELEKAKHVLALRSSEILQQIQPKQALLEKLRAQILKADNQLKQEKKRVFELNQKIQKIQKISDTTKKQNAEIRLKLSQKQKDFDELCWQIYLIVHNSNQKQWASLLIKVYQDFVKQQRFQERHKKKDQTSKELNRHLMHAEQSLIQISSTNSKSLKRKEDQIIKKMEQNSVLLYQLNVMRKNEKAYQKQKKEMSLIIQRLRRDFKQYQESNQQLSARNNTARSGMTNKFTLSRNNMMSQQKSTLIDTSDYDKEIRDLKTRNKIRRRMSSTHKTIMLKNQTNGQDNKFIEMAKEFQTFRNTIKLQNTIQVQQ